MEKAFDHMMNGFFGNVSDANKQKVKICYDKMVALCPCMNMKDVPEDIRKSIKERMKSCCGDKMEMMSSFFNKTNVQNGQFSSTDKEK